MNHRIFSAIAALALLWAPACGQKSDDNAEPNAMTGTDTESGETTESADEPEPEPEPEPEELPSLAKTGEPSVCATTKDGKSTPTKDVRPPKAEDLAGYIADLEGEGQLLATFHTSAGDIHCELFPAYAPMTVANFVGLARGLKAWKDPRSGEVSTEPLYNDTVFHRVIPKFMIQGGDPLGRGSGGPGYRFGDEFDDALRFTRPGLLAMANAGPSTNGSQIFITEVPTGHLSGRHTIFGQCDAEAIELVKEIARGGNSQTTLESVEITCGAK